MEALFALTFPIGKLALRYAGVLTLIGVRMTLAGSLMLFYHYFFVRVRRSVPSKDWLLFAQTTLFYVYLAFVPEFWALKSISSLKSNMLWSSLPFISALFGFYLCNERLTRSKWAGVLIGVCGMMPVIFVMEPQEALWGNFFHITVADCLMTVAVVSTAYGLFLVKMLMQKGYSLIFINGFTMLSGGLMCLATRLFYGITEQHAFQFWPLFGYILLLIAVSNFAGYAIYGYLLRFYSITFLSLAGFLCPLFGAVFGKLILNEHFHYQYVIAFSCVVAGLILFAYDDLIVLSKGKGLIDD